MGHQVTELYLAFLRKIEKLKTLLKAVILNILIIVSFLPGCLPEVEDVVGPSISGFTVSIAGLFGGVGIIADSTSQATIRVEVFNGGGQGVDAATVTLTTTLGTLGAASLTTTNGVAVTTLTSGSVAGNAVIVATVENASAFTIVPIIAF